MITDYDKNIEEVLEMADQNTLIEMGVVKSFQHYTAKIHAIDKAMFFHEQEAAHLKLLMILDQQNEETLRILHTYLELRLNLDQDMPKFPKIAA